MFLLDADDAMIPAFKESWGAIGDSIVVVGGDGFWNCHVHTNDVGAAVEAGVEAGRPSKIRVTDLSEQVEEEQWVRASSAADASGADPNAAAEHATTAVVAVAVGEGIQRLLRSLGVHVVVAGGQSMNPSTAQILEAVEQTPSKSVIVLPNNKNIVPVAHQVDGLTARDVAVVPTNTVVQALAALVSYDPDATLDANVSAMSEAAARVRTGEITQAVRASTSECGPIAQGDWIAVTAEGIRAVEHSAATAAISLCDQLVGPDDEIVTVLVGIDARPADTRHLEEHLALEHPYVEVEVHEGGQPLYPYLIGVE
jgi:hypothetical protein